MLTQISKSMLGISSSPGLTGPHLGSLLHLNRFAFVVLRIRVLRCMVVSTSSNTTAMQHGTTECSMMYFAFWMAQPASTAKWSTADLSKARVLLLNESEQHAT